MREAAPGQSNFANPTLLKAALQGTTAASVYYRWDADGNGVYDADAGGRSFANTQGSWFLGDPDALELAYNYPEPAMVPQTHLATVEVAPAIDSGGYPTGGISYFSTYRVMVEPRSPEAEADKAIDDGLWYLHKSQVRGTAGGLPVGSWAAHMQTAQAIEAFEVKGHLPTGDAGADAYVDTVERGLTYLLNGLGKVTTSGREGADGNGNGFGLGTGPTNPAGAAILAALCESQAPNHVATCSNPDVNGRTYADIAQDLVDYLVFHQSQARGCFYSMGELGDNGYEKYAVHALERAKNRFDIDSPAWAAGAFATWLASTQNTSGGPSDGAFGCYSATDYPCFFFTATGLAGLGYTGVAPGAPAVAAALAYLDRSWAVAPPYGNLGDYESMYGLALAAHQFSPALSSIGSHDWYAEYLRYLVDHQAGYQGGTVTPGRWSPSASGYPYCDVTAATAWSVMILRQRSADTTPPTVASDALASYQETAVITISAEDVEGRGVAGIGYKVDAGTWTRVSSDTAVVTVTGPQTHTVTFYAWDIAGNSSVDSPGYQQVTFDVLVPYDVPPTALPRGNTVRTDGTVAVTLLGSDPYHKPLTHRLISYPRHGTLSGTVPHLTYTPDAGFMGQDSFEFIVNNGTLDSAPAAVTITVLATLPALNRPVADPGGPYILGIPLVDLRLDARRSYDPDAGIGDSVDQYLWDLDNDGVYDDATGPTPVISVAQMTDQWHPQIGRSYRIALKVTDSTGLNSDAAETILTIAEKVPPVPITGGPYEIPMGSDLQLDGGESYQPYGRPLTWTWSVNDTVVGSGETLTVPWNLILQAWPQAAPRDWARLKLVVTDSADGTVSATALDRLFILTSAPSAADGQAVTRRDGPAQLELQASDPESDTLAYRIVDRPQHGELTGVAPHLTYTPETGFTGADTFTFEAEDGVLGSNVATVTVAVDGDAPVSSVEGAPAGWTNGDVAVTLSATDSGGAGVEVIRYRVGGGGQQVYGGVPITLSGEGATLTYWSEDAVGNIEDQRTFHAEIDTTAPVGSFALAGGALQTTSLSISADSAMDDQHGPLQMRFSVDGGASWTGWTAYAASTAMTLPGGPGAKTVLAQYRDAAGNVAERSDGIQVVMQDAIAPTVKAVGVDDGTWLRRAVTVTLTATHEAGGSGVASLVYSLDGVSHVVEATTCQVSLPTRPNGTRTLRYHAVDAAGNSCTEQALTVHMDTLGPKTAVNAATKRVRKTMILKYRIADALSPRANEVSILIKNARGKTVKTLKLGTRPVGTWLSAKWTPAAVGVYRAYVYAKDLAGNKQVKVGTARLVVKRR